MKLKTKNVKLKIVVFVLFFLVQDIYAMDTLVNPTDYNFKAFFHSRVSYNTISNTTDLSSDSDDNASYLAYTYDIGFYLKNHNSSEFFLKITRATRANYDAPVSGGKIMTWPGLEFVKYASTESVLPRLTEFWTDIPILEESTNTRLKLGLFPNVLGNGFVGGKYENYGFSFYNVSKTFQYCFHAEMKDYNNKINLGPSLDQEKAFAFENTNAYLLTGDFNVKLGKHSFEPYVSYLRDTTLNSSRANLVGIPTDEDNLGTIGIMSIINLEPLSFNLEYAKNFGQIKSSSSQYPDITHKGSLVYGNASLSIADVFVPRAGIIMASGNKITNADLENAKLNGDSNNAFSVYSPSNIYLFDTQYPKKSGPFIATGSGHAVNYGVPRQGTFSNANLLENLDARTFGFGFIPSDVTYFSVDYWMLNSIEGYPGTNSLTDGSSRELSKNLGAEINIFGSLSIGKDMLVNLIYAYFIPGDYYKEIRNQYSGTGFVPLVRGDGKADPISQIEIGIEFFF
jgi:hypothetical protein